MNINLLISFLSVLLILLASLHIYNAKYKHISITIGIKGFETKKIMEKLAFWLQNVPKHKF
jgi:cytochrome b subunit of formate dehydrogenase